MRCPFCGNEETQVKDSRIYNDGESIKRRRVCANCGNKFNTLEEVLRKEIYVIKKNGTKELFDKYKLKSSIKVGSGKRLTDEQIIEVVNKILSSLELKPENEVQSRTIGVMVMNELEKLDTVAFIRFASVYMNFEDPEDFNNFIKKINKPIVNKK